MNTSDDLTSNELLSNSLSAMIAEFESKGGKIKVEEEFTPKPFPVYADLDPCRTKKLKDLKKKDSKLNF